MKSRTENSAMNFAASAASQIISIVLSLFSRTVFIKTLGEDYLGINGLFSNIITVLSLAELGIGTAIVYSMYAPIVQKDRKKIAALVNYYKTLYGSIAIIVTIIGLAIFPFLDFFINLDTEIPNVKYYYLLFLAQTVSSYLIVYRSSILTADQKGYLITKNTVIGNFLSTILQIILLLTTHSYGLYTATQIIVGLLVNYINSRAAVKQYPYILEKEQLEKEEKKKIWINIRSMFSYKVGSVILNNTDNLLISKLVSTTVLGFYSNYTLIIAKASSVVNLIFSSLQASLGNYNADNKDGNLYFMFKVISFIEYSVYAFCCICFMLLMNDFITIWVGERFVLSSEVLWICVVNFYIQGVLYPIWCYRNTTGLFRDTKFMMFFAAGINLILSIFLGMYCGLFGILVSTAIARLCTNMWYEPYILFKRYFSEAVSKYYFNEFLRAVKIFGFIVLSQCLFSVVGIQGIYLSFFIKILYCVTVPIFLLWLENRRKDEYKYIKGKAYDLIKKMRKT